MEQDWTTVVLKGRGVSQKQRNVEANRSGETISLKKGPAADNHLRKVAENNEGPEKIKLVSREVANRIQQGRLAKNWTQKELAKQLNIQPSIIANYENAKAPPNDKLLQRMSKLLGVKLTGNLGTK